MNESENKHSETENTASKASDGEQIDAQNVEEKVTASNENGAAGVEVSSVSQTDSTGDDVEVDLAAELENAQLEIVKLKDAFLRAKAEEDNVRRRSEKEVANSRKFAVEGFAKEMMNVHDSLKLALSVELADDADEAIKSTHEGVSITLKQLESAFSKFSVSEIAPESGDKLDPNLHQAMSMIESEEVDPGQIISVIQAGFSLHDRLLRPALVVVAK